MNDVFTRKIDLEGYWNYELDEKDIGISEEWYKRTLTGTRFSIPGTTATNSIGTPVAIKPELTKEAVNCLRERWHYTGAAWYQTVFTVTDTDDFENTYLFLERVMWESKVWIDGKYIGRQDSLSTPHIFDIEKAFTVGTHVLTIRVDNRDIQNIGPYPSAYTDQTQTIWNGIVGSVILISSDIARIKDMIIGCDFANRTARVKFVSSKPIAYDNVDVIVKISYESSVIQEEKINTKVVNGKSISITMNLSSEVEFWDEFNPHLYSVQIVVLHKEVIIAQDSKTLGFKEISRDGGIITINGVRSFFRGNIDCCVYPKTAHPPADEAGWERVLKVTKDFGFNHVRFHSWCPPESAFSVADRLGLYLQVEGPLWMDNWTGYAVGTYPEHFSYLPGECEAIINSYSFHPSFCIFSCGNELNGDFSLLQNIIREMRFINPYILYTLSTNWDRELNKEDDLFIAQSIDGTGIRGQYFLDKMVSGTQLNFDSGVSKRSVPSISHEVGQYVVYPNVDEIPKYNGVLRPINLEAIKNDLIEKDLYKYLSEYIHASGKLSEFLYKSEFEAVLRTKNISGIQILGLQDFPGQSTATIGLLDSFFEDKGIITADQFKCFCNDVVPLAIFNSYIYYSDELLSMEVKVANYSSHELINQEIELKITAGNKVVFEKKEVADNIPVGLSDVVMSINQKAFIGLKGRNKLTLSVEIIGMDKKNFWDIWVYERADQRVLPANSFTEFSEEAKAKLNCGETVVLFPSPETITNTAPSKYFPVFWSPVHFISKDPCGIIIDNQHPFFSSYFKCENYGNYEWKDIVENSSSIILDKIKGFEPITMLVPNFYNNCLQTNFFEAKVSKGKLIVCCIDQNKKGIPQIEYFTSALKDYAQSRDCNPTQTLSIEQVDTLFTAASVIKKERVDIALGKPAYADSEKANMNSASKGNDGNPTTEWSASDASEGHYWQVDLEDIYDITETKIVFKEVKNYMYVIHTSVDGEDWTLAVNKTGQVEEKQIHTDVFHAKARFVKVTYNSLPPGIWAGHRQFSVYAG